MSQRIFGVDITRLGMHELLQQLAAGETERRRLVFTMNVDHVVQMHRDPRFRDAYAAADIVTIDGAPVLAYARTRGLMVEKVAGSDLFAHLMPLLVPGQCRLFFILSDAPLCSRMRTHLEARGFPSEELAFSVPPYGFEFDGMASRGLAAQVRAFAPTHVFVCVGSPKSEIWCSAHASALGSAVTMCVGASAEFYLGTKQRAPQWVQRASLEWLWRWAQEPRRLFRRYFVSSWGFLGAIRDDVRSRS